MIRKKRVIGIGSSYLGDYRGGKIKKKKKTPDFQTWMMSEPDSGISCFHHSVQYTWKIDINKIKLLHIWLLRRSMISTCAQTK